MRELARRAPRGQSCRVYLVGGGTAVLSGWRPSTLDVDLNADNDLVFRQIQAIKEALNVNVEFVRPEDFVPSLAGSDSRHVFIETIDRVSFFHHDPYAQTFAKLVRGFDRDRVDAEAFVKAGMVDPKKLQDLVNGISPEAWSKYPALSPRGVAAAVQSFVEAHQ